VREVGRVTDALGNKHSHASCWYSNATQKLEEREKERGGKQALSGEQGFPSSMIYIMTPLPFSFSTIETWP
jgi:hypothetical protein